MTIDDINEAIVDVIEQLEDIQSHEDVLLLECEAVVDTELIADAMLALKELHEQINA